MVLLKNIDLLFDNLWPGMLYIHDHKTNCVSNLHIIQNVFKKFDSDHNLLLNNLCLLDGIGLTIASGLIWSVYPNKRVPFDKYTLTYALQHKLIRTEKISENYVKCCDSIKLFCNKYEINKRSYTIKDFVREAQVELEFCDYLIEPN